MTANSRKIPVIIVAGFLGSGKTTLLNYLLRQSLGMRIGVIVNDFGSVNIDAMLVGKQAEGKIEMSNGCICCTLGEGGIDETLDQLAYKGSDIDAIIIEASGIAEPGEVAFLVQASGNTYIEPSGIVYIVDAAHYKETRSQHEEIAQHIKVADILIVNKVDSVGEQVVTEIAGELRQQNQRAPIVKTVNSQIDPKILFDIKESEGVQLSFAHIHENDHAEHLHSTYTSVVFETDKPLDPQALQQFLKYPPRGVHRMKGFAYFGMKGLEQKFIVQMVGKHYKMHTEEWEESPKTQLVVIGINLDTETIISKLEQCIDSQPDVLTKENVLNILNY